MKVSDITQQIKPENKVKIETKSQRAKTARDTTGQAPGVDTVELSSASREVQKMQAILQETPAVRAELVQTLQGQIDSGNYQVDSRKVAEKIISSFLSEELGQ